jgi:hypothetical protein
MLVLITTSIWLFVFIHWPKSDQSGLKNKCHPNGDKFHSMLRKGSVSKSIHDGDEDGEVGRNVRTSHGLINGSSSSAGSSASSIISSSSSSILMPQHSNNEKAFQTNSRQNENNIMVKGNQIICSDGSKGVQNDDYCDCSDGSDELQTSACSHILVHSKSFACADGISFIFLSRVKDGVDDCPDGSDEM